MFLRCVSIIAIAISASVVVCDETVLVQTENGPLRGAKRGQYYAFEGIPYAKAPLGELRLAPSELNDARWENPRDATTPGPVCLQWSHFEEGDDRSTGEEDCLFMNIYTPALKPSEPLPTIFFIHGGAFMFGNGDFYEPDNVMNNRMVLVTFNYRLGPLGFLSTEDDVIPGNFGLKDQVTALKWVRQNIANFGGDQNSITMVGYSAGSASVQLHYLSSMSRGLFKNGIGHSGSALNPWVLAENSADKASMVAAGVGCPTSSSERMLECLRSKPAKDVVRAVEPLFDFLYNPFSPLGVVIEKKSKNNPEPFLADHPYKMMKRGEFYRVPMLLSVSQAEGLYPGAEFASKTEYLETINSNWNKLLPSILDYQTSLRSDESQRNEISRAIRERYLGDKDLNRNNFRDFLKIISNRLYFAGVVKSAKLMQAYIPVHFYYGMYKTKFAVGEYLAKSMENFGVAHGEDVLLVFKTELRDEIPYTEEELLVGAKFVEMYEKFARESVAKFGEYEIPRMEGKDALRFLEINYPASELRTARQLSDEDFWNQLNFNDGMPVDATSSVKNEL
ncbi:carboxylic ester hydrolase-like [Toxorhynchites rutilus septentrionalis]|uniref:carboxylic ester hydrolase-like n=1 Tax=Toxorhynchites rutilus septentrionalis TaxID=329112 RepID=UPI00247933D9|nr:carboxylic ester hydrolase-like [Toxorhynchites rutilus septentrionalis]